jgi:flagellar biosynthesis component FlhA
MNAQNHRKRRMMTYVMRLPVLVAVVLLLLPLVPLLIATYFAYAIVLQIVIWICWSTRGVNVLLVYSDSPEHGAIHLLTLL